MLIMNKIVSVVQYQVTETPEEVTDKSISKRKT